MSIRSIRVRVNVKLDELRRRNVTLTPLGGVNVKVAISDQFSVTFTLSDRFRQAPPGRIVRPVGVAGLEAARLSWVAKWRPVQISGT